MTRWISSLAGLWICGRPATSDGIWIVVCADTRTGPPWCWFSRYTAPPVTASAATIPATMPPETLLCLRVVGGSAGRWGSETAYSGPRGEGIAPPGSGVRTHDGCGAASCVPWNCPPWNCPVGCGVWNRPVVSDVG